MVPKSFSRASLGCPVRLRNNTSAGLAARLRLRDATSAATMTGEVERTIELAADGGAHWVPITFLTGRGMLELKTEGHQWAADHVELSPTTAGLLSAQRVIVFDPEPLRCGDSMSVMDDIEAVRLIDVELHVNFPKVLFTEVKRTNFDIQRAPWTAERRSNAFLAVHQSVGIYAVNDSISAISAVVQSMAASMANA